MIQGDLGEWRRNSMAEEGKPDAQLFQLLSNLLLEVRFNFSILVFWIWLSIRLSCLWFYFIIILLIIIIPRSIFELYQLFFYCNCVIIVSWLNSVCFFFSHWIVNCNFYVMDASFVWNWKYTVITILLRDVWVLSWIQTELNLIGIRKRYNKTEQ